MNLSLEARIGFCTHGSAPRCDSAGIEALALRLISALSVSPFRFLVLVRIEPVDVRLGGKFCKDKA